LTLAAAATLLEALQDILRDFLAADAGRLGGLLDIGLGDVAVIPVLVVGFATATTQTHGVSSLTW
jgi:hypothetical protein